jgi:hypothetical protein
MCPFYFDPPYFQSQSSTVFEHSYVVDEIRSKNGFAKWIF